MSYGPRSRPAPAAEARIAAMEDAVNETVATLWEHLRDAGMPEVMLFLPDGSACRCHWEQTASIGGTRVALLGDQDRNIVRIVPVDACTGIGIAAPKGTDPAAYRSVIQRRLDEARGRLDARRAGGLDR